MDKILEPFLSEKDKVLKEKVELIFNSLPKIEKPLLSAQLMQIQNPFFHLGDKTLVNSGDMITRPLESFESGRNFGLLHYGIVCGESINKERLVLEMNEVSNVSIVTLEIFLTNRFNERDIVVEKRKPENIAFVDIIARADMLRNEKYSVARLNCEQFANYCVFGIRDSKGLQNMAEISNFMLGILSEYLSYKIAFTEDKSIKESGKKIVSKLVQVIENIGELR